MTRYVSHVRVVTFRIDGEGDDRESTDVYRAWSQFGGTTLAESIPELGTDLKPLVDREGYADD